MKEFIKDRIASESGSSEVVTTLFMLPIVLWLILSVIDVSLYFQAKTMVQNSTRDGARQVAIWGGNQSPISPLGQSVSNATLQTLYNGQTNKCTPGNCSRPPAISCTPPLTNYAGDLVSCTTTYYYKPINPANPIDGFAGFLNSEFTVTEYARSETGFR